MQLTFDSAIFKFLLLKNSDSHLNHIKQLQLNVSDNFSILDMLNSNLKVVSAKNPNKQDMVNKAIEQFFRDTVCVSIPDDLVNTFNKTILFKNIIRNDEINKIVIVDKKVIFLNKQSLINDTVTKWIKSNTIVVESKQSLVNEAVKEHDKYKLHRRFDINYRLIIESSLGSILIGEKGCNIAQLIQMLQTKIVIEDYKEASNTNSKKQVVVASYNQYMVNNGVIDFFDKQEDTCIQIPDELIDDFKKENKELFGVILELSKNNRVIWLSDQTSVNNKCKEWINNKLGIFKGSKNFFDDDIEKIKTHIHTQFKDIVCNNNLTNFKKCDHLNKYAENLITTLDKEFKAKLMLIYIDYYNKLLGQIDLYHDQIKEDNIDIHEFFIKNINDKQLVNNIIQRSDLKITQINSLINELSINVDNVSYKPTKVKVCMITNLKGDLCDNNQVITSENVTNIIPGKYVSLSVFKIQSSVLIRQNYLKITL